MENTNETYSPYLTVRELFVFCGRQMKKWNADKKIMITSDDEGNGYHGLFYQFTDDVNEIKECYDADLFHDNVNPEEFVLLG